MNNGYDVSVLVLYTVLGATYTAAFSLAVLCHLFTFSVICYFDFSISLLHRCSTSFFKN